MDRMRGTGKLLGVLAAMLFAAPALADGVSVSCAVQNPAQYSMTDLRAMAVTDVTVSQATDHGAFTGTFHGVLLWTLIDKAAPIDATGKNTFLRHTVLVSSSGDQYAAAVSEGEIHPKLENKRVILATDENGAPLATPMLIVPGDAHASRAVKDVTTVTVQ
jgi:hypothetical protein